MKKSNTSEKEGMVSNKSIEVTDASLREITASDPLVVVDCWAPWCGPCYMIAPIIEELAWDYAGKVLFGKLNVARMLVPKLRALDAIAARLRKSPEAVRKKIDRLGLEVVDPKGLRTTTSLKIPNEFASGAHVFPQIRFSTPVCSDHAFQRFFSYPKHAIMMAKKESFFSKYILKDAFRVLNA
jgi:thiol-disulfide isomerase/thioredoxin